MYSIYASFSITGALTCHFEICCPRKSDEATGERQIKVVAERGAKVAAVFGIFCRDIPLRAVKETVF